jgi:hypothetical protein
MIQLVVEKLLNIEQFFFDSSFKSKLENLREYGHALDIVG